MTSLQLSKRGDELLRRRGFTIWGRKKEEVDPHQREFERQMLVVPNTGRSRRNNKPN